MRQFSLYLRSGISLPLACSCIATESGSTRIKTMMVVVERKILEGNPLSKAFSQFPKEFDAFSFGLLRVGETTGTLSDSLEHIATHLQKHLTLRQKIGNALTYPALVASGTVLITLFLLLYIFPKILPIFTTLKVKLPLTTRVLIAGDSFITSYWSSLLIAFVFLTLLTLIALRFRKTTEFLEQLLLWIPFINSLYKNYLLATIFSMLSIQLETGVPIIFAIDLIQSSIASFAFSKSLQDIQTYISEGQSFSASISRYPLFSNTASQLIAAGETTGTLQKNCHYLGELFEERIDRQSKTLLTLIEPVLMICMGITVGFVALAIIMPIYQVTQNLTTQ